MKERKQMTERKERGITLIALVVTIIVLIILATVSINMVVGENGLIKKAEQARDAYEESAKRETEGLNTMLEEMMKETGVGPHGLPLVDTLGGGTSNVVLESTVDAEDVNGNKIVVPRGFFVRTDIGTKVNDGIVIEDKQGNQFVWVPCTEEQYKKHVYNTEIVDDAQESNCTDSGNNPWKTYYYRKWNDWKEESNVETNTKSVKENGGFYVARFEAGVPDNASFSVNNESNKETMPYYTDSNSNGNKSKNVSQENGTKLKPVSKQGMQAWNYINQTNAVEVSKNMYSGAESSYGVTSQLIDGIAWDRTVDWLGESYSKIASESTQYGNYYNTTGVTLPQNTLYAQHVYATVKSEKTGTTGWVVANKYRRGSRALGKVNLTENDGTNKYVAADYINGNNYTSESYTLSGIVEMSTGAISNFMLKNIYDMAGNMYEWTTETGHHNTSSSIAATDAKYAVFRGGSFISVNTDAPVSLRRGSHGTNSLFFDIGFRVVLYVK